MRFVRILLTLFMTWLLMWSVCGAHATTVTGLAKVNGQPFTGSVIITLSYPGSNGSYINLPAPSGPIPVVNGILNGPNINGVSLDGNDTMLPSKTYYAFDFYDTFGNEVTKLNYYITGSTFDIGTAVPTPVLTNNVSFLDLLGLRSLSVQNLTINNALAFGNLTINQYGITNAENVNGVLFASAYNVANPSSTTCGIQEAHDALPTTGGIVVLPEGLCSPTTTVNITKPIHFIGFGQGGFADSSTYTSVNAGTTLNYSGTGALFSVGPTTSGTLSGVTFDSFMVNGNTTSPAFLIGQSSVTSFVRDVTIRDVFVYNSNTCGINLNGNVSGFLLDHSVVAKTVGSGLCLSASNSYQISGVRILDSQLVRNTVDGMRVNSAATQGVTIRGSNLDYNTNNGISVISGSTGVILRSTSSTYRHNGATGLYTDDGSGSSVQDDVASSADQQYGYHINPPSSTNVNFTIKDATYGGNTNVDIFTGATAHEVVVYPSKTTPTTTQTVAGTIQYVGLTTSATSTDQYFTSTTCSPATSTDSSCTGTITISPAQPDSAYFPFFALNVPSGAFYQINVTGALTTTTIPYTLTCTFNCSTTGAATVYVHLHHN